MADLMNGPSGRNAALAMAIPSLREDENDAGVVQALPDAHWHDELFLSRASTLLTESLDEATIRDRAIHMPLPYLADWCALHLVATDADRGNTPFVLCAHVDPDQEPRTRALWQRIVQVTPRTIPSFNRILHNDERPFPPCIVDVPLDTAIGTHSDPQAEQLLARVGLATAVHVPLVAGTRTLGVFTFSSVTPRGYGPRQVALAVAYASRVAGVLDRAQRYRQAVEILRARDVALVEIAHDLKVPAAQIVEYAADLYSRLSLCDESQHNTRALRDCSQIGLIARSLLGMLDDLTPESVWKAGTGATLVREETDLVALVRQTVERYSYLAGGYTFHFDVGELDRVIGYWNPGALRRILDNLVSNAITFSQPGDTITVRVWRGEARAQLGSRTREWAYLQVRDEGAGIPACDLPHIFEPFYRGSNAKNTDHGTGIGLTSVRSLVQRLGGKVRMASELGEGACLTIMLPLDHVPPRSHSGRRSGSRNGVARRTKKLSGVLE